MLHNICKDRNLELNLEDEHEAGQPPAEDIEVDAAAAAEDDVPAGPPLAANRAHVGLQYMENFARLHFG